MKKFILGVFVFGLVGCSVKASFDVELVKSAVGICKQNGGVSSIETFEFVGGDGYANSITVFCKNGVSKRFTIK